MWRCSSATMVRPFASNRERTLPTSPRLTASGLRRTRVRWDMPHTLVRLFGAIPLGLPRELASGGPLGALDLDLAPEEVRGGPEREEDDAEHEHGGDLQPQSDGSDLDRPTQPVGPLEAQQPRDQDAGNGETEPDPEPGRGGDVGDRDEHRRAQSEGDRLEGQDRRAEPPLHQRCSCSWLRLPSALRRDRSMARAATTVTTEPVTSTPPEPIASPNAQPASASAAAWSSASASDDVSLTRSCPKMPSATSASSWAGIEREVEFWVHTTWARTGSSSDNKPS